MKHLKRFWHGLLACSIGWMICMALCLSVAFFIKLNTLVGIVAFLVGLAVLALLLMSIFLMYIVGMLLEPVTEELKDGSSERM